MTLPGPDLIRGVLNTDWTVPREGDAEGGGGGVNLRVSVAGFEDEEGPQEKLSHSVSQPK